MTDATRNVDEVAHPYPHAQPYPRPETSSEANITGAGVVDAFAAVRAARAAGR